jgi:hypothetical protein
VFEGGSHCTEVVNSTLKGRVVNEMRKITRLCVFASSQARNKRGHKRVLGRH